MPCKNFFEILSKKKSVTKEMKKVLYVLLFSPYLNWEKLNEFINQLLIEKSKVQQFLMYFQKVWIKNKKIRYVGEHIQESILTNCALESYHKRLNSALEASSSVENFYNDLFAFDMKNLREIKSREKEPNKYNTFLAKKEEIYELMKEIVKECAKDNEELDPDLAIVDENAEEWCEYNEHNNQVFTGFLFENSLSNNSSIIDMHMNQILDQFKPG